MAPIRHPKITGYDVKYSWNFKVRSQHFLKWVFLINNDIKYEYKDGINQWWQGQGCFICYFLWGMTTHGSNSRSNDIKTTALPLSKTFNLPAIVLSQYQEFVSTEPIMYTLSHSGSFEYFHFSFFAFDIDKTMLPS